MQRLNISREKSRVVRAIRKLVEPHMWESGYRLGKIGESRPLRLWVPKGADNKPTMTSFKLRGGFVVETFEGFTEEGVITDGFAGGLVTTYYRGIPLDDLYKLLTFAERKFAVKQ